MQLIYDMRILGGNMHGMARYGLELLSALLAEDEELGVAVLVRKAEDSRWLPQSERVLAMAFDAGPYSFKAQRLLPRLLRRLQFDVYHCPFYAPPLLFRGPMVFTIHDLIHLRFPQDHGFKHRQFYHWVVAPSARMVPAVFTVSRHSRQDIVQLLGASPQRVVVTPNGVGPAFKPLAPEERGAAARDLDLPGSYILGVGNPKPHKNLAALVEAHGLLKATLPDAPPLVLVGLDKPSQAGAGDDVLVRSHMEDADLARAYGAAGAVCVPSLYEGFGLPALEALAAGAPLVASNAASLPEVVGQAGLLAEPKAPELAAALERVLIDASLAEDLRARGPAQAARFTWQRTAKTTLEVYRRIKDRQPVADLAEASA